MAIRIDKEEPRLIDKLPAKVSASFVGRQILCPRVIFRNKKNSVNCLLNTEGGDGTICAILSASLGNHGGGVYYLDFYDGCHLCATVPVELDANCMMTDCTVETIEEGKWPRWKEKQVG